MDRSALIVQLRAKVANARSASTNQNAERLQRQLRHELYMLMASSGEEGELATGAGSIHLDGTGIRGLLEDIANIRLGPSEEVATGATVSAPNAATNPSGPAPGTSTRGASASPVSTPVDGTVATAPEVVLVDVISELFELSRCNMEEVAHEYITHLQKECRTPALTELRMFFERCPELCKPLTEHVMWFTQHRCAVIVDTRNSGSLTATVVVPATVHQSDPSRAEFFAIKDAADTMHASTYTFVVNMAAQAQFEGLLLHVMYRQQQEWKKRRLNTCCPAFVVAGILGVLEDLAMQQPTAATPPQTKKTFLPEDAGVDELDKTGVHPSHPWTVLCTVVRHLLAPLPAWVTAVTLTTFLMTSLSSAMCELHATCTKECTTETLEESRGLLAKRQTLLVVLSQWLAQLTVAVDELHLKAMNISAVQESLSKIQETIDKVAVSTGDALQPKDLPNDLVKVFTDHQKTWSTCQAAPTAVSGRDPREEDTKKTIPSLPSRPQNLAAVEDWVRKGARSLETMLEIERLLFDLLHALVNKSTAYLYPGYDTLKKCWETYETECGKWCSSIESHIDRTKCASRKRLVAIVIAILVESKMHDTFGDSLSSFTALPEALINRFLDDWLVDAQDIGHVVAYNIKKCLERPSTRCLWANINWFGNTLVELKNDHAIQTAVERYDQLRTAIESMRDRRFEYAMTLQRRLAALLAQERQLAEHCSDCRRERERNDFHFHVNQTRKCQACQNIETERQRLEQEVIKPLNFPFASRSIAALYWPPKCVNDYLMAATTVSFLLDSSRQGCNNIGADVFWHHSNWLSDVKSMTGYCERSVEVELHIHDTCQYRGITLMDLTSREQLLHIAQPNIEHCVFGQKILPVSVLDVKPLSIHPKIRSYKDLLDEHPAPHEESNRGNLTYTESRTALLRQDVKLGQNKLAILGSIRSFGETQHRLALHAMLFQHIDGKAMEASPEVWSTVLLAGSHGAGLLNDDHNTALTQLAAAFRTLIEQVSLANALMLVPIAQQFGLLSLRELPRSMEIVSACIIRAGELLEEVLKACVEKQQWQIVKRISAIALSCCAFIPSTTDPDTPTLMDVKVCEAYVLALIYNKRASIQLTSGHDNMTKSLQWLMHAACHRAIDWLLPSIEHSSNLTNFFVSIMRRFDATVATMNTILPWERKTTLLHVVAGVMNGVGTETHSYQVNLYNGEVYVNGSPVDGLPAAIRNQEVFKELFGSNKDFDVCVIPGGYRTVNALVLDKTHSDGSHGHTEPRPVSISFLWDGTIRMEDVGGESTTRIVVQSRRLEFGERTLCGEKHVRWKAEYEGREFAIYHAFPPTLKDCWMDGRTPTKVPFVGIIKRDGAELIVKIPHIHQFSPLATVLSNAILRTCTLLCPVPDRVLSFVQTFEPSRDHVSCTWDPTETPIHKRLVFERHGTSFDAVGDAFVWHDDAEYVIDTCQTVSWLPCFKNHIRLTRRESGISSTKPEEIVLLPRTVGPNKERITCSRLSRHSHFEYIEAPSMSSRLYVAALLTAADCGVSASRTTEDIMMLLRRSMSNEPLNDDDVESMSIISRHRHPSVTLLAAALTAASREVAFLHQIEPHADDRRLQYNSVQRALTRYQYMKASGTLRPACALSSEEIALALGLPSNGGPCATRVCTTRDLLQDLFYQDKQPAWFISVGVHLDVVDGWLVEAKGKRDACNTELMDVFEATISPPPSPQPQTLPPWTKQDTVNDDNIAQGIAAKFYSSLNDSWSKGETATYQLHRDRVGPVSKTVRKTLAAMRHIKSCLQETIRTLSSKISIVGAPGTPHHGNPHYDAQLLRWLQLGELLPTLALPDVAARLTDMALQQPNSRSAFLTYFDDSSREKLRNLFQTYCIVCSEVDCLIRLDGIISKLLSLCNTEGSELEDGAMELRVPLYNDLTSPRQDIEQHSLWLVFEAERQIRIRAVQFDTWRMLSAERAAQDPALVTQLNMGEGKTRVVIPMLILSELTKSCTACVHALSSVVEEYTEAFESSMSSPGLGIHVLHAPFNRDIHPTPSIIDSLKRSLTSFQRKMILLVREHGASYIEKNEEMRIMSPPQQIPTFNDLFGNATTLHIFDEVDELLRCDYGLVYAIGSQTALPNVTLRGELLTSVLMTVAKLYGEKNASKKESWKVKELFSAQHNNSTCEGEFPSMYITRPNDATWFVDQVIQELVDEPPRCCNWMRLDDVDVSGVVPRVTDTTTEFDLVDVNNLPPLMKNEENYEALMLLRGLGVHKVLAFALARRPQENYGVPPSTRDTLLAVPYEAADVPSQRSEFAQPDVALLLTLLAYFHRGLTFDQFKEAMTQLVSLQPAARRQEVNTWLDGLPESFENKGDFLSNFDVTNEAAIADLYTDLYKKMPVVSFWVRHCVFSVECRQFPGMLKASAWDIASVPRAVGFSGTSDGRWLLPELVTLEDHTNPVISGATGTMLRRVLANTIGVVEGVPQSLQSSNSCKALAILHHALDKKCQAVIDIGARFAGKSLSNLARDIVKDLPCELQGVCYFDTRWMVLHKNYTTASLRESSCKASQCFVLFDQARCRGSDLKLSSNTVALVTIGEETTKDEFMQGVGRLRQFGHSQRIRIVAADDVLKGQSIECLIKWLVRNTLVRLSRSIPTFIDGAAHHAEKQREHPKVVEVAHESTASKLYAGGTKSVDVCTRAKQKLRSEDRALKHVLDIGKGYAYNTSGDTGVSQTTEREVCREVVVQEEKEVENLVLEPEVERRNEALIQVMTTATTVQFNNKPVAELLQPYLHGCVQVPKELSATMNFGTLIKQPTSEIQLRSPPPAQLSSTPSMGTLRLIRRVSSMIVSYDHRVAFWISEKEAADIDATIGPVVKTGHVHIRHIQSCEATVFVRSSNIIHDEQLDELLKTDVLRRVFAFTALFNGITMLPDDLHDATRSLFTCETSSRLHTAAKLFLVARDLDHTNFPSSDLEDIVKMVVNNSLNSA